MWYGLVLCDFIMAVVFGLKYGNLPPQIPLFYSKTPGEEQMVDLWMIVILPILMNGLVLANLYILRRYFTANDFVKKIISYLNLFLIIAVTAIFVRIIFLVS